jgi:hypothetical protein
MTLKKAVFYLVMLLIPFAVIEGFFRLLPVSSPPYIVPVSLENPVAHLQPDVDYLNSIGWNFAITARKHSNNFGYNNLSDYHPDETTPLLMVIGDSYVQADQVDAGNSAAEILDSRLDGKGRVYSAGLNGAPLSQYLVFAEFSKTTFRPNAMAFVIIGNDFDESFAKYKAAPERFHYFAKDGDGFALRRVDYALSTRSKILRRSAFVRYFTYNLRGREALARLLSSSREDSREYVGNVPATVEESHVLDAMSAVDEFFRQLPQRTGLDNRSILFVLDGMRPALYSSEALLGAETSYASRMRRYFTEQAASRGYEVIDMQPVFIEKHASDGSRFEFEIDAHWNELGHVLAAAEIQKSAVFARSFQE